MRKTIIIISVIFMLGAALTAQSQELWTSKDGSIRNVDTRAMFVDGRNLYLATKTEIYASSTPKNNWRSIFFLPANDNEIACITGNTGNLFIGTKRGLFKSQDSGKTWRNVFRTIIPEKSSVRAIDISNGRGDTVIIGTQRGLFISGDGGERWRDISGVLKSRLTRCIAFNRGHIYVGSDDGLYMAEDQSYQWRKIYACTDASDGGEAAEETSDIIEPENAIISGISSIAFNGPKIYIAENKKILCSDDMAKSWRDFSTIGLSSNINSILVSRRSNKLFCATTKGVFEFHEDTNLWNELYAGMDKAVNVKNVLFDSADEKTIWAITDKGLYKLEIGGYIENQYVDVEKSLRPAKIILDGEPSFKELQSAAMRFNEVNPGKITEWRAQARMRALVPKVSVGFDNSKSNNSNIVAAATVPDRDRIVTGPDDINEGFDVSVSWDLADIIWSDDQTNIDVRSRLTTQLRNDILDDLRRVYFERRRLQYEMLVSPPMDTKLRFEKELRIQELTQAIDDTTGNYLSDHLKEKI